MNPYVQPVLYIRRPGSDIEECHRFPDDDPFFSEVSLVCICWVGTYTDVLGKISVLIDNIEDIEEDPETAQILSTFEGTWYIEAPLGRR